MNSITEPSLRACHCANNGSPSAQKAASRLEVTEESETIYPYNHSAIATIIVASHSFLYHWIAPYVDCVWIGSLFIFIALPERDVK